MTLVPHYRLYELPWSPTEEVEQRFRKVLRIALIVFAVFAVLIPLLPVSEKPRVKAPDIPDRVVKLVIERPAPPPPPPPVVVPEEIKPEPIKETPKPPEPKPQLTPQERAKKELANVQDQLAALRDMPTMDLNKDLSSKVEATRSERNTINSKVGVGSGGINTSGLSRGYGGNSGELGDIKTTRVTSAVAKQAEENNNVRRGANSTKATRSEEEISLIFDKNKGPIYQIYSKALREKPELKGKVVLELTISPEGTVTSCRVLSSELGDPELENKLVQRVKIFRFEARDVGSITVTKPIDFFPA